MPKIADSVISQIFQTDSKKIPKLFKYQKVILRAIHTPKVSEVYAGPVKWWVFFSPSTLPNIEIYKLLPQNF
jgi:hypothetical protein